ncbi:MAG: hypothetical protein ACKVKR_03830 [Pseudomonadales bacterium]
MPGKSTGWSLLRRSAWRYVLQHRWQTGLNILGILIGVMMVVAVDLANTSARKAFDSSIDSRRLGRCARVGIYPSENRAGHTPSRTFTHWSGTG